MTGTVLGDIGGTNARFTIAGRPGELGDIVNFRTADFATFDDALRGYLDQNPDKEVTRAAVAVAGLVSDGAAVMTNLNWTVSARALKDDFGYEAASVVNDFAANAMAVPLLQPDDVESINAGRAVESAPVAVIGPGTGLGVAALVPGEDGPAVVPTEGGHVAMAPADDEEYELLRILRREFGHVSAERVLSGQGIVNLYRALAAVRNSPAVFADPAEITGAVDSDALAAETLSRFFAMLGGFVGDTALTLGARGGVYLMGGILPRLGERLQASSFLDRVQAKGRFRDYLREIPIKLAVHENPALLGLSALAE